MNSLKQVAGPLLLALVALAIFQIRIRHEMVDFGVYWQAGTRAAHHEPLYRPEDGHYQFKYLPIFAAEQLVLRPPEVDVAVAGDVVGEAVPEHAGD